MDVRRSAFFFVRRSVFERMINPCFKNLEKSHKLACFLFSKKS